MTSLGRRRFRRDEPGLGLQGPAGGFDFVLQAGRKFAPLQARLQGWQELDDDGAGLLAETAPRPQDTGIEGDWHNWCVDLGVKRGHAGMIAAPLSGCGAGALGK